MKIEIGTYKEGRESGIERPFEIKFIKDDFYSLDVTLSMIISASIKEFKEKHCFGSPYVDDSDVPEELQCECDDDAAKRNLKWMYVLDEMIWTFDFYANHQFNTERNSPDWDRAVKGMQLFANYFTSLWN